jgi:tRNA(Arg) A34 adenosine deaminase TadA
MRHSLLPVLALMPLLLAAAPSLRSADRAASIDDPACTAEDRKFMARAYELAEYATTHGGGPFGALLVKDHKIIAEFSNCVHSTGNITTHAEMGIISGFSPRIDRKTFSQSTLYTSTEPCAMCCGAICFAGIGRVVYGVSEIPFERTMGVTPQPNPLTSREIISRISPSIKVLGPLMEEEGLKLHAEYWTKHPEDVGKS